MKDLEFVKDENSGLYVCEFDADKAGLIMINREGSGSIVVYAKTEKVSPIVIDYSPNEDNNYIAQLNITGCTIRIESKSAVVAAQFV